MTKLYTYLAVLATTICFAQQGTLFGINGGATFAGIRGNDYADEFKYGFNYLLGVSLEVPLSDKLSFMTNINYEKKSPKVFIPFVNIENGPIPGDDPAFMKGGLTQTTILHYIAVPLNLKYYIGSKRRFYVNGGLYAAFLIDKKFKLEGNKTDDPKAIDYKTLDFGLNAGFGTRLKLTEKQNLNIELRDNFGLTNISDINVDGADKIKTNSVNLIVNWQFSL